jgi:hypothetical protein
MKIFDGELFVTTGPHKGGYLPGRWVRAEEMDALRAENERLTQEGARYRWIRNYRPGLIIATLIYEGDSLDLTSDRLDALIDRELKRKQKSSASAGREGE